MDLISRLMIGSTSALTKYEPLRKRKDENVQHPFKQICARNEINPLLFLFSIPLPPPLDQTKQNEDQVLTPACAPRRACSGTCAGHSESSRTMFSPGIFEKKSRKPLDWDSWDVMFFRIFFIIQKNIPQTSQFWSTCFLSCEKSLTLVDLHSRFFIIEGKHWFLAGPRFDKGENHMSPTQTMHCLEGKSRKTSLYICCLFDPPQMGNSMTPVWENSFWCMSLPELFPVILAISWILSRFNKKIRYSKTLDFSWPSKNLINVTAFFWGNSELTNNTLAVSLTTSCLSITCTVWWAPCIFGILWSKRWIVLCPAKRCSMTSFQLETILNSTGNCLSSVPGTSWENTLAMAKLSKEISLFDAVVPNKNCVFIEWAGGICFFFGWSFVLQCACRCSVKKRSKPQTGQEQFKSLWAETPNKSKKISRLNQLSGLLLFFHVTSWTTQLHQRSASWKFLVKKIGRFFWPTKTYHLFFSNVFFSFSALDIRCGHLSPSVLVFDIKSWQVLMSDLLTFQNLQWIGRNLGNPKNKEGPQHGLDSWLEFLWKTKKNSRNAVEFQKYKLQNSQKNRIQGTHCQKPSPP